MPHVMEAATSGRSKCRGRGRAIEQGTLRFADELRSIADVQVDASATVDEHAVTTFQRHIEALRGETLEASDLEDSHSHELRALIAKKRKAGKDAIAAQFSQDDETIGAQIVDLMEYLKKSIGGGTEEPTDKSKRPRSAKRKVETSAQPKKPRKTPAT